MFAAPSLLVMNESNTKLNLLTKHKMCLKNASTLPRKIAIVMTGVGVALQLLS
jgi:hypothetical protein